MTERRTESLEKDCRRVVYFCRAASGMHKGQIKIGFCVNLQARVSDHEFSYGTHIEVLAVMPASIEGARALEGALHERFAKTRDHHRNEWFNPTPEMMDYIDGVNGNYVAIAQRAQELTR